MTDTPTGNCEPVTDAAVDRAFGDGAGKVLAAQLELTQLGDAVDELREEATKCVADLRALGRHAMDVLEGLDPPDYDLPGTRALRASVNLALGFLSQAGSPPKK